MVSASATVDPAPTAAAPAAPAHGSMPPPQSDPTWDAALQALGKAQTGLIRLTCPALAAHQLASLAEATTAAAIQPLLSLARTARMGAVTALIAETRSKCEALASRRAHTEDRSGAASEDNARSRSASADRPEPSA